MLLELAPQVDGMRLMGCSPLGGIRRRIAAVNRGIAVVPRFGGSNRGHPRFGEQAR